MSRENLLEGIYLIDLSYWPSISQKLTYVFVSIACFEHVSYYDALKHIHMYFKKTSIEMSFLLQKTWSFSLWERINSNNRSQNLVHESMSFFLIECTDCWYKAFDNVRLFSHMFPSAERSTMTLSLGDTLAHLDFRSSKCWTTWDTTSAYLFKILIFKIQSIIENFFNFAINQYLPLFKVSNQLLRIWQDVNEKLPSTYNTHEIKKSSGLLEVIW